MEENITARLDYLFATWQQDSGDQIVKDGVIQEDEWNRSRRKILFVLKEPNGGTKKALEDLARIHNDLRQVEDPSRAGNWAHLGRWAYGLLGAGTEHIPAFGEANGSANMLEAWRRIALMNLKKTPGKAQADMSAIEQYASANREALVRQLDIMQADIVVCCGENMHSILFGVLQEREAAAQSEFGEVGRGEDCWLRKGVLYVQHYHPGARLKSSVLYYGLVARFQQALVQLSKLSDRRPAWAL